MSCCRAAAGGPNATARYGERTVRRRVVFSLVEGRSVAAAYTLAVVMLLLHAPGATGGEPARLTHDGKLKLSPVYMPDGESIAFSVHDEPNKVVVKRLDPRDGSQKLLFPNDTAHQFDAAFSPDGQYWSYCRSAGIRQLILVVQDKLDNDREYTYLPSGGSRSTVRSLAFTPNGHRIIFTHSGNGGLQIASLNTKCEDLKYLTRSEGTNYWPAVSPDGNRIAFSSSRSGPYDIFVMDVHGNNVERLTESTTREIRPAWSPDGRQIAFTSFRDGNHEIYVMNADGSNARRATNHPDRDDFPTWQPDGRRILTVAERDGQSDLYLIDVPD